MYIRSRRVPYSRGFRPREQAGRGGGRGARVFLPFSRRACNGTKVATLCATCHVHSVLRIHAWHYVCARHQRAADGPLDAPFLFESSTTSLVRAPCAALLYQMPVTSESMVVITVNVTGWASILSAKGFGFGRRDRERIYSSCFSRLFSSEECYYGDRAIFSVFGINLFWKRNVCETRIVETKRSKSFHWFGFWYWLISMCA